MKPRWIILLLLLIPIVAHLAYATTHSTFTNYYITVDELLARGNAGEGAMVRLGGSIVPGTIQFDGKSATFRFRIRGEGQSEIAVEYRGRVPNVFRDNARAIVEGTLDPDGVFHAHTLMVRCPHEYAAAV